MRWYVMLQTSKAKTKNPAEFSVSDLILLACFRRRPAVDVMLIYYNHADINFSDRCFVFPYRRHLPWLRPGNGLGQRWIHSRQGSRLTHSSLNNKIVTTQASFLLYVIWFLKQLGNDCFWCELNWYKGWQPSCLACLCNHRFFCHWP